MYKSSSGEVLLSYLFLSTNDPVLEGADDTTGTLDMTTLCPSETDALIVPFKAPYGTATVMLLTTRHGSPSSQK